MSTATKLSDLCILQRGPINAPDIGDSSPTGRALLTTVYAGEGTAVPVIGGGGGSVIYTAGVSGTPATSTDGVVTGTA